MNERLNIRRMQVPESKPQESVFDPARDITPLDWLQIDAHCKERIDGTDSSMRMEVPVAFFPVAILDPDREILRHNGKPLSLRIDLARNLGDWRRFLKSAAFNTIMGEKADVSFEDWQHVREYVDGLYRGTVFDAMADAAAWGKIIDPSKARVSNLDHGRFLDKLNRDRSAVVMWDNVARVASDMKILGLDFSAFTKVEWERMHEYLDDLRANAQWQDFLDLAAAMKILAADKVEVPEQGGLEITMPEKTVSDDGSSLAPETLALE